VEEAEEGAQEGAQEGVEEAYPHPLLRKADEERNTVK